MRLKKRLPIRRRPLRKRAAGRKGSSVSVAVQKYVNKSIARNIENKMVQIQYSASLLGYAGTLTMNQFPLTPYAGFMTIAQGVSQNARLGNEIRVKKLMYKYVLRPLAYDVTVNPSPQPVEVQIIFANVKNYPASIPGVTDYQNLYQLNGTSTPPTGALEDLCQPFNKDYWNILKVVRHKIGYSDNFGTGANASTQYYSNNDFKLNVVRRVNVTKLAPKIIKFNDTNNTPTSRGLFVFFNVIPAGQSAPFGAGINPIRLHSYVTLDYEDA
jgi:hypothetical protein